MATRRRRAKVTPLAGVWGAFAALFTFLAVTTEMLLWVVIAMISLLAAVVACFNPEAGKIASKAAVPPRGRQAGKSPTPGGRRNSGGSPRKPGTRKKPACGARCRRSIKDPRHCDCSCNGRSHGSEVGRVFTGGRAEASLKSKQNRSREKQHVKERETWRK